MRRSAASETSPAKNESRLPYTEACRTNSYEDAQFFLGE